MIRCHLEGVALAVESAEAEVVAAAGQGAGREIDRRRAAQPPVLRPANIAVAVELVFAEADVGGRGKGGFPDVAEGGVGGHLGYGGPSVDFAPHIFRAAPPAGGEQEGGGNEQHDVVAMKHGGFCSSEAGLWRGDSAQAGGGNRVPGRPATTGLKKINSEIQFMYYSSAYETQANHGDPPGGPGPGGGLDLSEQSFPRAVMPGGGPGHGVAGSGQARGHHRAGGPEHRGRSHRGRGAEAG